MPNPHTNNDLVGRKKRPQGGKYCDNSEAKYALKERTPGRRRSISGARFRKERGNVLVGKL